MMTAERFEIMISEAVVDVIRTVADSASPEAAFNDLFRLLNQFAYDVVKGIEATKATPR